MKMIKINSFFFCNSLAISHTDVDDVRDVLANYKHHENPIEVFRENQRKYQAELASQEENKAKVQTKPLVSGLSFLRRR